MKKNHSEVKLRKNNEISPKEYLKKANQIHDFEDEYHKMKDGMQQQYGKDLQR